MAVFGPDWAEMTGGSGNIAFTSMWFHSEMNIAFMDTAQIKNWVGTALVRTLAGPGREGDGTDWEARGCLQLLQGSSYQ